MITLNDVNYITVGSSCMSRWPCGHDSTVTLKDGRCVSNLDSFQICSIVSNLANEKINPGKSWVADDVKRHFEEYNESLPSMGWIAETPEVVLNILFPNQKINESKLSFDLENMLAKAEAFSKNDECLVDYITNILTNEKFQSDPKEYIDAWRVKRGYTEEYRFLEDKARMFFNQNFI